METNELSNIWKKQAEQVIKPYSISELDKMIVKNARHSMSRLFPGLKIKVVLSVLVIFYFLWQIIAGQSSFSLKIFYGILIAIIIASWTLAWIGLRKMQKPNPTIPVKDWIKDKIDEIDKSMAYQKKHQICICAGAAFFVIGICMIQNFILNGTITLIVFVSALTAVSIMLYFFYIGKKRFIEVRNYLQALYELLTNDK